MNISKAFTKLIAHGNPVILDGGLATELEHQGFDLGSELWSAELLINNPQAIIDAHLAYLNAGAQIITTASYQATIDGFIALGLSREQGKSAIANSVDLACQARILYKEMHSQSKPLIAASIGPYGAYLSDGSEYSGNYDVGKNTLREFHEERLLILDHSDADVLACETIPSFAEATVLHDLLLETGTPAWISFSCRDGQHLNDGTRVGQAAKLFANHPIVLAVGINCTAPGYISPLIQALKQAAPSKAIAVYPNSGELYDANTKSWGHLDQPVDLANAAIRWHKRGAGILGGCCRIGPRQIMAIARAFNGSQDSDKTV